MGDPVIFVARRGGRSSPIWPGPSWMLQAQAPVSGSPRSLSAQLLSVGCGSLRQRARVRRMTRCMWVARRPGRDQPGSSGGRGCARKQRVGDRHRGPGRGVGLAGHPLDSVAGHSRPSRHHGTAIQDRPVRFRWLAVRRRGIDPWDGRCPAFAAPGGSIAGTDITCTERGMASARRLLESSRRSSTGGARPAMRSVQPPAPAPSTSCHRSIRSREAHSRPSGTAWRSSFRRRMLTRSRTSTCGSGPTFEPDAAVTASIGWDDDDAPSWSRETITAQEARPWTARLALPFRTRYAAGDQLTVALAQIPGRPGARGRSIRAGRIPRVSTVWPRTIRPA